MVAVVCTPGRLVAHIHTIGLPTCYTSSSRRGVTHLHKSAYHVVSGGAELLQSVTVPPLLHQIIVLCKLNERGSKYTDGTILGRGAYITSHAWS